MGIECSGACQMRFRPKLSTTASRRWCAKISIAMTLLSVGVTAPGHAAEPVSDTVAPSLANRACLADPTCSERLGNYETARNSLDEAEKALEAGLKQAATELAKDDTLGAAAKRTVGAFNGDPTTGTAGVVLQVQQLSKLISANAVLQLATAIVAIVERAKSDAGSVPEQAAFEVLARLGATSLTPAEALLSEEAVAKLLAARLMALSGNGSSSAGMQPLPLAALARFRHPFEAADVAGLRARRDVLRSETRLAANLACRAGAVIEDAKDWDDAKHCEATSAQAAKNVPVVSGAKSIRIQRAEYGDTAAGRWEIERNVAQPSRKHTCDATGHVRNTCEFHEVKREICTQIVKNAAGVFEVKLLPSCPDSLDATMEKQEASVRVRVEQSICPVKVSYTTACGGFNPAPQSERELYIQYKCSDGVKMQVAFAREGGTAFLDCSRAGRS